jgi:hypothetical protein
MSRDYLNIGDKMFSMMTVSIAVPVTETTWWRFCRQQGKRKKRGHDNRKL